MYIECNTRLHRQYICHSDSDYCHSCFRYSVFVAPLRLDCNQSEILIGLITEVDRPFDE